MNIRRSWRLPLKKLQRCRGASALLWGAPALGSACAASKLRAGMQLAPQPSVALRMNALARRLTRPAFSHMGSCVLHVVQAWQLRRSYQDLRHSDGAPPLTQCAARPPAIALARPAAVTALGTWPC